MFSPSAATAASVDPHASEAAGGSLAVAGYRPPPGVFDELSRIDAWGETVAAIDAIAPDERARLWQRADRFVVENGTTYNVFQDQDAAVRPWNIDLYPFVLAEDEFEELAAGLRQRARLLEALVADIYGPQRLLHEQGLPPAIVYANPGYERAFRDLVDASKRRLLLCGFELARDPTGRWYVMADRLDSPAGCGYALENRFAVSRALPQTIKNTQVRRLASFFERLQLNLQAAAVRNFDDPRIVLLSGGPNASGYFEDVFLARYLGYLLVQVSDLAVRDNAVFVKTIDGLLGVDVVFNRLPEAGIDSLECSRPGAGVTGLVNAIRQRTVAVVNSVGCGLLESPVWMPYLPSLCRLLLGEELKLPSIATWWCGTEKARGAVLKSLDRLVVKPAFEYSGRDEFDVAKLSASQRAKLVEEIEANPDDYVAQEKISRSACPSWQREGIQTGHVALRAFLTPSEGGPWPDGLGDFDVMPGALVRVAGDSGPFELSISAGHSSKDAWIQSSEPVQPTTLLNRGPHRGRARRNAHLVPCRVAENMHWFGRKLDRLDVASRLLRAVVNRVDSDQPAETLPELRPLLSALVGQGLIDKKEFKAIRTLAFGPTEGALTGAVIDANDPNSLRGLVRDLRQRASNLRDRLSEDTWKATRRLDEMINVTEPRAFLTGEGMALLDNLIAGLASCSGLIGDGMVRGVAWRFFKLGRLIGRAERTIEFLLDTWIAPRKTAMPSVGQKQADNERAILEAVLEVMDGRITYRSRYLADLNATLILDLVVFDESNPRSLAHQFLHLSKNIDRLPRDPEDISLTPSQREIRRAVSLLQLDEPEIIGEADPAAQRKHIARLLRRLSKHCEQVSLELTRGYLVLSRGARERDEGAIRLA